MEKEFDAIVVLACGIDEDGQLHEDPKESVDLAVQIYKEGRAPLIIFSGSLSYKATFTPPLNEAQAMKAYAADQGIPAKDMLIEDDSKDTLGNAYFTKKKYLVPKNLKYIIVILGPNHSLERVKYIFDKVLGGAYETSFLEHYANRPGESEREHRSLAILRQWLDTISDGDDKAIYNLMKSKHPAYSPNPEVAEDELKKLLNKLK